MKVKRNPHRGTASITFSTGPEDDAAFDEWLGEAKKPGTSLFDAAEKVARKRGVKTKITTAPLGADDDE